jgi:hypothetical protein
MPTVERRGTWWALLTVAGGVLALYLPALSFELMGDDFLLVQLAHAARHDWRMLFAALDTFYRPSTTWTLVLDWVLWGHRAWGYHLTNLLLRIGNAALLFFGARRIGFGSLTSWAVALVWACSPFSAEPVYVVGARIDELLTASWLTLVVAWPRRGETWTSGRLAVVITAVMAAALTKETWVVTVCIVVVLELAQHGATLRQALVSALPVAGLTVVYVALHFALLPGGTGYFTWSLSPLAKIPHQMAAFLHLEPFALLASRTSAMGFVGLAVVAGFGFLVWRYDRVPAAVGASLLLLPQIPTLLVPYLPSRYTSVPYIGFLLLVVAGIRLACSGLTGLPRLVTVGTSAFLGAILTVAGALTVRADLLDMRRVSDAHARVLAEASRVADTLPVGVPIAVVRTEAENPLRDIAQSVSGSPKLLYYRREDAYGLTDTAALFEWVLGREDLTVRRWDDGGRRFAARPGVVLLHGAGGFTLSERREPDIGALGRGALAAGAAIRFLTVEPQR